MPTLKESLKFVNEHQGKKNEIQIKLWTHFDIIKTTEVWKVPDYYDGYPDLKYFMESTFEHFLKKVFRKTMLWFNSVETILRLKNGKDLFIKYGRSNMVTYTHSTPVEQQAIIAAYKNKPTTVPFIHIKNELFPLKSKTVTTINYQKEYLKTKKELKKANDQIEKLQKEIKILEDAIAVLTSRAAA
jgi:hypothetical protein